MFVKVDALTYSFGASKPTFTKAARRDIFIHYIVMI